MTSESSVQNQLPESTDGHTITAENNDHVDHAPTETTVYTIF